MRSALDASINTPPRRLGTRGGVGARPLCITSVRDATPVDEAAERWSRSCRTPRASTHSGAGPGCPWRGSSRWGATSKVGASDWPSCTRSTAARLADAGDQPHGPDGRVHRVLGWRFRDCRTRCSARVPGRRAFRRPLDQPVMAALLADALCGIGDLEGAKLVSRRHSRAYPPITGRRRSTGGSSLEDPRPGGPGRGGRAVGSRGRGDRR